MTISIELTIADNSALYIKLDTFKNKNIQVSRRISSIEARSYNDDGNN